MGYAKEACLNSMRGVPDDGELETAKSSFESISLISENLRDRTSL